MPPLDTPQQAAQLALQCLDLTSLGERDSIASIDALAARAHTRHGTPAALCVYARFVATAREALARQSLSSVRVATVVNFPRGDAAIAAVTEEIHAALAAGADEIDAVFPWRALLAGDVQAGPAWVKACRRACDAVRRGVPLKIILETGELREAPLIRLASVQAVQEGADFLKTSTGKVAVSATPAAVAVMLEVIAPQRQQVGLKVAGGLATLADVQTYLRLAREACGEEWLTPSHLRFGASSLLPVLVSVLDGTHPVLAPPANY